MSDAFRRRLRAGEVRPGTFPGTPAACQAEWPGLRERDFAAPGATGPSSQAAPLPEMGITAFVPGSAPSLLAAAARREKAWLLGPAAAEYAPAPAGAAP
ncbi:hypothetical protein QMO56_15680 [Roseomonas sp. E05]|uniref:hypothetical protein n=1 Tax=Roseomonas sp. E05 TaxID=3046310 RepID=UPI0024B8E6EE|nr:hypothetical protein [Roseomonas sp. E05]MDJ0389557.1 hypothetical protein [Roseomonas sp. E05]